jgi:monovalent cation/hydrogen antiporter
VVVGLYIGRHLPELSTSGGRLIGVPFWQMIVFILNNILFLLTGLQLRTVIEKTADLPVPVLIYYGALISSVVIVARIVWVYPAAILPRALSASLRKRDPLPPLRQIFIVSWTGMRGSVSLAAALGIPAITEVGSPFPVRDLIIFITFCVILSTLVLQGSTLPPLIRWLGIDRDGKRERRGEHHQEAQARIEAAKTVLTQIDTWEKEEGDHSAEMMRHLRRQYEKQIEKLNHHLDEKSDDEFGHLSKKETELQLKALAMERSKMLELRNDGVISDDVYRLIEVDLDLHEMRLRQDTHLDQV